MGKQQPSATQEPSGPAGSARRIAYEIQALIRRERIPPGGRLPTEHALAHRFGVGRPLVREAIGTLRVLGVVESRPRVGLRVLAFDPGALLNHLIPRIETDEERTELYELRCLLEPAILSLVVRRASPEELDRLDDMLRAPLPAGAAAIEAGLQRDIAFHESLWRLAKNRYVWGLRDLLLRFFVDLERGRGGRPTEATIRKTNIQHRDIVRALRARQLDRAVRALDANLRTFDPNFRTRSQFKNARRRT